MSDYIVYIMVILVGLMLQRIKRLYIVSNIIIIISYILTILIADNDFLTNLSSSTKLEKSMITYSILLFYGSSTFSFMGFKFTEFRKLKKCMDYSNYIVEERIQNTLDDIKEQIQNKCNILGDHFSISLFYIDGRVFKSGIRIGYSQNVKKIVADWDGIIKNIRRTSIGYAIKDKRTNIIDHSSMMFNKDCVKLPSKVARWHRDNLSFKINIPIAINEMIMNRQIYLVRFVIVVECTKETQWEHTSDVDRQIRTLLAIIRENTCYISCYNDYYSNYVV